MKSIRYLSGIAILLLAILTVMVSSVSGKPSMLPQPMPTAASLPTPGPEPTTEPDTAEEGKPVANRAEAIQRALQLNSFWAVREQPLTESLVALNPDMVTVEQYATRQEAADMYGGGVFVDPEIASEPVWVVIIRGKVYVRLIGLAGASTGGGVETDGVTYIISQKNGNLLEVAAGILQKQISDSP